MFVVFGPAYGFPPQRRVAPTQHWKFSPPWGWNLIIIIVSIDILAQVGHPYLFGG